MRSTRRVLVGIAVPLAVLAGCGGQEAATTTAVALPAGADDTTQTTPPVVVETVPATAPTTAAAGGSAFCNLAAEADVLSDAWDPNDPASNQVFLTELAGLLSEAAPVIPAELATDFPVFASTWAQITVAVQSHAWDFNALTAAEVALLEDPGFTAATEAINTYEEANC